MKVKALRNFTNSLKRKVGLTVSGKRGGFKISAGLKSKLRALKSKRINLSRFKKALAAAALKKAFRKPKVRKAIRGARRAKKYLRTKNVKSLLNLKAKSKLVFSKLQTLKLKSKYGTPREKIASRKALAIFQLVAKERASLKASSKASTGGQGGLLIGPRGQITRGKFVRKPGQRAVLYTPTSSNAGEYSRVGEV